MPESSRIAGKSRSARKRSAASRDSQTSVTVHLPSTSPAQWKINPLGGLVSMSIAAWRPSYLCVPTPSGKSVVLIATAIGPSWEERRTGAQYGLPLPTLARARRWPGVVSPRCNARARKSTHRTCPTLSRHERRSCASPGLARPGAGAGPVTDAELYLRGAETLLASWEESPRSDPCRGAALPRRCHRRRSDPAGAHLLQQRAPRPRSGGRAARPRPRVDGGCIRGGRDQPVRGVGA